MTHIDRDTYERPRVGLGVERAGVRGIVRVVEQQDSGLITVGIQRAGTSRIVFYGWPSGWQEFRQIPGADG